MNFVNKVLNKLEHYIINHKYENIETESIELKNLPPNQSDKAYTSIKESLCAFLNTNGGIIIIGIKEDVKNKQYVFSGYHSNFEESIKLLEQKSVKNYEGDFADLSEYVHFEIKDFLEGKVLVVHIDKLPQDKKYVFLNGKAFERKLTGDHIIQNQHKILAQEEYKKEIEDAKELYPVVNTTIQNLSIDKLNDYIYQVNKEIKIESAKADHDTAKSFLLRKSFINKEEVPTVLGMLVCGENLEDYLGNRCQVDCYVDSHVEIAINKKIFKDNIIQLLENSIGFVYRNIQVGLSIETGGSGLPEYPEDLIRECINNSLAHRDYTMNRFVNINIEPQKHIEIRNPGGFKKTLLLTNTEHEIPLRRIVPNQKPVNPKLADILKVFNKYEGRGIGMATLVNECIANKIDLPYYKFNAENDISLIIPSGQLVDEVIENLLNSFSGYIEKLTNGDQLTESQKSVFAYLYKSEMENENYRYTILLTPDNNHLEAIKFLEKNKIIYKHEMSTSITPIFILDRSFLRTNFADELKSIFGNAYLNLKSDYKKCLNEIYKINKYSKFKEVSATQIGNVLFYKQFKKVTVVKDYENFKRKIRYIFNKLEKSRFIIKEKKKYLINTDFFENKLRL